jgi:hypothetical protein
MTRGRVPPKEEPMSRTLITTVRQSTPEEPLLEVDHVGLGASLVEVLKMWAAGHTCPENAFIEKTKAVDEAGEIVGFNYYIVEGEPIRFGGLRSEPA